MRERTQLETQIAGITKLERDVEDALTLIELGEMEEDEATIAEGEAAIKAVEAEAGRLQVESLLSGEADMLDTYVEIHPGAGGTETQHWAEMLLRMYRR
jgi:peptide chain release factor 2